MLNNLIKYSIRSFKRQRSYIIINILGLSIGIACSLLIALFIINEAGYDKYNIKKDRIYRLILNGKIGGQEITAAYTAAVIGPTMAKEFPEIEDFLRMNGEVRQLLSIIVRHLQKIILLRLIHHFLISFQFRLLKVT